MSGQQRCSRRLEESWAISLNVAGKPALSFLLFFYAFGFCLGNFFLSCCCREPPMHNNNQQFAWRAVFCVLGWVWVAGWLCNLPQAEQKKNSVVLWRETAAGVLSSAGLLVSAGGFGLCSDKVFLF